MKDSNIIKERDLVIVQKGSYFKACRITNNRPQRFGKYGDSQTIINLEKGIGHMFGTIFKLTRGIKKTFDLELHDEASDGIDLDVESGIDNRNILDDGQSQTLSKSDIKQLVDSGVTGDEVIQTLAQNNKTFKSKTKYSQEKYVSKKAKKYDELVTIHRPSIRLLVHMFYSQDPLKISNLRIDSLSQILAYVNVQPGGTYVVYEAGMQGLITAALLNQTGSTGSLVHVYSGTYPHRDAIELMGFSMEELLPLSYIGTDNLPSISGDLMDDSEEDRNGFTHPNPEVQEMELTEGAEEKEYAEGPEEKESTGGEEKEPTEGPEEKESTEVSETLKYRKFLRSRSEDIQVSTKVLRSGATGLIVACRQHPSAITVALLAYLRPGHSFAVFSPYKETLMDLFMELKTENCVNVRIVENWLRNYQVLPQRTHPEVNMSGGGGYILTGWKVGK